MSALSAVLLILLGFIAGAFGTLIGAGGGFILTPLLLLLYPNDPPEVITSITLAVVFFNALSGSLAYAKMKRIDYRTGTFFAAATVPGAILGALATQLIPRDPFDGLLGVVLCLLAVYISAPRLVQRTLRQKKTPRGRLFRSFVDAYGHQFEYRVDLGLGMGVSFVIGFLSSLLGIGGGIIHVPALIQILGYPVHIATATSHFILVTTALTGTVVHITAGNFHGSVLRTLLIGTGVVLGAQVGARLALRVGGPTIIRLLALALFVVGVRLILLSLEALSGASFKLVSGVFGAGLAVLLLLAVFLGASRKVLESAHGLKQREAAAKRMSRNSHLDD